MKFYSNIRKIKKKQTGINHKNLQLSRRVRSDEIELRSCVTLAWFVTHWFGLAMDFSVL